MKPQVPARRRILAPTALAATALLVGGLAPATAASPPGPAGGGGRWDDARQLGSGGEITDVGIDYRYINSDSQAGVRAMFVQRDAGKGHLVSIDGPPLKPEPGDNVVDPGSDVRAFSDSSSLTAWLDNARHEIRTFGTGVDGGQGSSWGVTSTVVRVPGTQGLPADTAVLALGRRSGDLTGTVLWSGVSGGVTTVYASTYTLDYFSAAPTFEAAKPVWSGPGTLDEFTGTTWGKRSAVAFRITQGTQRTVHVLQRGAEDFTGEQVVCDLPDTTAGAGCGSPQIVGDSKAGLYALAVATTPAQGALLQSTPLTAGGSTRTVGPITEYAARSSVRDGRTVEAALVTRDQSGVQLRRVNPATRAWGPPVKLTTSQGTQLALSARYGRDVVGWSAPFGSGTRLTTVASRGKRVTPVGRVDLPGTVAASGLGTGGVQPARWWVVGNPGDQRLWTSLLDDSGPNTLVGYGLRASKKHPRRLDFGYEATDYNGVRRVIVQVRHDRGRAKSKLGAWKVLRTTPANDKKRFSASVTFRAKPGVKYCVRVLAIDTRGNRGSWWSMPSDDAYAFERVCRRR